MRLKQPETTPGITRLLSPCWRVASQPAASVLIASMLVMSVLTMEMQPVFAQDTGILPAIPRPGRRYCQIVLSEAGVLRANVDSTALSSKEAGGRAGVAQVTTNSRRYRVAIDAPTGFSTRPAGGNNNVTFSTSYLGSGATNFGETPGNIRRRLRKGTTRIETHFVANRTGDTFPAGTYGAQLVLRCE